MTNFSRPHLSLKTFLFSNLSVDSHSVTPIFLVEVCIRSFLFGLILTRQKRMCCQREWRWSSVLLFKPNTRTPPFKLNKTNAIYALRDLSAIPCDVPCSHVSFVTILGIPIRLEVFLLLLKFRCMHVQSDFGPTLKTGPDYFSLPNN